jgi:hypothetical protein
MKVKVNLNRFLESFAGKMSLITGELLLRTNGFRRFLGEYVLSFLKNKQSEYTGTCPRSPKFCR